MWLAIILWTSVFRGIWLLIQNCKEKVTNNQGLGCNFHIWVGSQPPQKSLGSSFSFHVLGTQSSCLSLESSCEEFKGALSRSASPRNVLHADFSQNLNMAKLTMGPSFYLDCFPTNIKIFGMLSPPLLLLFI